MKRSKIRPAAGALAALILTSACATQSAPGGLPATDAPGARTGSPPGATRIAAIRNAIRRKSHVDPAAHNGRLLYVADVGTDSLFVYTYPQLSGAGVIWGFGSVNGVCTDRQGYVWVLDTSDSVAWEFAHGATEPIAYVQTGDVSGNPGVGNGCAVNAKTGDLAVAGVGAGFTVFRNGQETHSTYWDYNFFEFTYVGYDGAGNLFADGLLGSSLAFGLVELPKGSSTVNDVTLSGAAPKAAGGIEWDGRYLDIGDSTSGTIYQTNGSTVLGSVNTGAQCMHGFYILANHKRVIGTDPCNSQTGVYAYPAGGDAIKTVSGGQLYPYGVAISVR